MENGEFPTNEPGQTSIPTEQERPDYCPSLPVKAEEIAIGSEAWGRMNQRRAELIRKKNRQGLNGAEKTELDRLQAISLAALEKAFPPPTAIDAELQKLRAKFHLD